MIPTTGLLSIASPTRIAVLRHFVAHPRTNWSVRSLHANLGRDDISADAVRAVLYLLLDNNIVQLVTNQRVLTVRLAEGGQDALAGLLRSWSTGMKR